MSKRFNFSIIFLFLFLLTVFFLFIFFLISHSSSLPGDDEIKASVENAKNKQEEYVLDEIERQVAEYKKNLPIQRSSISSEIDAEFIREEKMIVYTGNILIDGLEQEELNLLRGQIEGSRSDIMMSACQESAAGRFLN